jgi:rhomboid protease GluP
MNCSKYKPTFILIAINVAIYIAGAIVGGNAIETGSNFVWDWGQVNGRVLFDGAYWQLFSSMFVHASVFHLMGNMLFLLIFGLRGEEMFSLSEFIGIYLIGGLVGNLLSLSFGAYQDGSLFVSVGASGAIFALFGACVIYSRRSVRQSILGALVYAFFLFFLNVGPSVNLLAHLGGLAFGLIIGYLIASRRKPHEEYSTRYSYSPSPF